MSDQGHRTTPLRLRPLEIGDEPSACAAHAELEQEGFAFLLDWSPREPWSSYVERLGRCRRGDALPPGWVPSTFLVADVGGEVVGRTSIRHDLNEYLAALGGHIGYAVRPAHRGRGHAHEILRQSLVIARAEGIGRVLVTCDDDNIASRRTIERLGGVLDDVRAGSPGAPLKRRYWIH